MRRTLILLALLVAFPAAGLEVPPPPHTYLSDFAGVVDSASAASIESNLAALERSTGHQVVVAVFPSLEGEALEDFTIRCAERWKVGRKGLDDGLILFVFVKDRRMRFEVGYGLEATVPDIMAARLLDLAKPSFRRQEYGAGILAVIGGVGHLLHGEPVPSAPRQSNGLALGNLVLVLVLVLVSALFGRRRPPRGGGFLWGALLGGAMGGRLGGGGFGGFGGFSGGGGGFGGGGASGGW
jgi:uncharacterized protein